MNATIYQAIVAAGDFSLGLCCNEDEIRRIDFIAPGPRVAVRLALAHEAARQLRAYLKQPDFRFSLPLAPAGTVFQRRVWARISTIPAGRTQSYGELAAAVGTAPRAVGGACGSNPYPVVVPCHRVISANGALGGFARERGGFLLDVKRWLLRHERAPV